jgi:hypothetical protein
MRADLLLDHDRGARENLVRRSLPRGDRQREVALPGRFDERCIGRERGDGLEHGRKRVVFDLELLGRIDRGVPRLGHDHRDRLTDVGHFRRREQRDRVQPVERLQFAQEPLGRVNLARDADRLGASGDVRRGEDGRDAGHLPRGRRVHGADRRMRVRAADEMRDQRAGHL